MLFVAGCTGTTPYQSTSKSLYRPYIAQSESSRKKEVNEIKKIEKPAVAKIDIQEIPVYAEQSYDIFGRTTRPSLFLLEPDPEVLKAYYYFFNVRKGLMNEAAQASLPSENEIPLVVNDRVQKFIDYFQNRGRTSFSIWLSRSGKYMPMMKEILESKGMPLDLVYLAMIESGFSVSAKSHKGAVGPWQFIVATAKRYGLRVDAWVDERMDPEKSTLAAARYLSDLYDMFASWELAAAGYNAGEERVKSAITKYNVSDFWEISQHTLPRETKDYVPKLMAALAIAKNKEKYGFTEIEYHEPEPYEKVSVPSQISLSDLAKVIGVDYARLRGLNPGLRLGATPPGSDYEIKVPVGYARIVQENYTYISALDKIKPVIVREATRYRVKRGDTLSKIAARNGVSIAALKKANRIKGSTVKAGRLITIPGSYRTIESYPDDTYTASKSKRSRTQTASSSSVRHKVRRGDTLTSVASRYGVSVSSIKSANNINGSAIRAGQVIRIPGGKATASKSSKKSSSTAAKSKSSVVKHNVRKGDTLWNIADRYDVSVSQLKNWNNLKSSNLAQGDRLKIYVK